MTNSNTRQPQKQHTSSHDAALLSSQLRAADHANVSARVRDVRVLRRKERKLHVHRGERRRGEHDGGRVVDGGGARAADAHRLVRAEGQHTEVERQVEQRELRLCELAA